MQRIKVAANSELGMGLQNQSFKDEDVYISFKTKSGESVYRGILHSWTIKNVDNDPVMEADFASWNDHWGEIAARNYGV